MNLILIPQREPMKASVFADVRLNELLSEGTVRILRYPCDRSEIARRQSIFSALEKKDFARRFADCRWVLSDLAALYDRYRQCRVESEKLFLFACLLERFLTACQSLKGLSGESTAVDEMLGDPLFDRCGEVRQALDRMYVLRRPTERFVLTLSQKRILSLDYGAEPYIDRLIRLAEHMGLEPTKKGSLTLTPDECLSEAWCTLFENDLSQIHEILDPFMNLDVRTLIDLIYQMDFCLEILELTEKVAKRKIPVCYPKIAEERRIRIRSAYDITLLCKNVDSIVPNDVDFTEETRFFFLTGANGGGKTTYLRTLAVNLVLFLGGCPIFAEDGDIYPFTDFQTHFPSDERFDGVGRLDEEVLRVNAMLERACRDTVLLFNETFSGTDDEKGVAKTMEVARRLSEDKMFGLFVTHFHEVCGKGFPILRAEVSGGNRRSYRIFRDDSGRGSYALDILKKYGLDAEALMERSRSEHE